jgi:formate/nitrite transporter FocA (FNT family)
MNYGWGIAFLRGIPANWLVCLAISIAMSAEDISGKILGCFIPIMTFATTGFEHCIANMFFVPLSLMYGAKGTFGKFIYANLIPVTLGNILGE